MYNKDVFEVLCDKIRENYKDSHALKRLSVETGVNYHVLYRILNNPEISPSLRNVQPLINHFGLVLTNKNKRGNKTVN